MRRKVGGDKRLEGLALGSGARSYGKKKSAGLRLKGPKPYYMVFAHFK